MKPNLYQAYSNQKRKSVLSIIILSVHHHTIIIQIQLISSMKVEIGSFIPKYPQYF